MTDSAQPVSRGAAAAAAVAQTDVSPGNVTIFDPSRAAETPGEAENDFIEDEFENPANVTRAINVRWAADGEAPDYNHLLGEGQKTVDVAKTFSLTRREFDLLIEANSYRPQAHGNVIAFGIRGATLRDEESFEQVDTIPLQDARPNHVNFRCVMGWYDRNTGKISAYTASTVPWHEYMSRGMRHNLLPSGCYIYKVGTHAPATQSRWCTPALRLSDAKGAHSGLVTVLRNTDDLIFDYEDEWDQCAPSDNVHCAYSSRSFSSLGCQTVKGGMHDGLWADFQAHLKKLPANARVDYLLVTGAEVSMAAALTKGGADKATVMKSLGRMRFGSEGERVNRLQAKLGLTPTGYFGASTKTALLDYQEKNDATSDGIYTPALDAKLGWNLLAEPLPATAPPQPAALPTPPPVAPPPVAPPAPAPTPPIAAPAPAPTPAPAPPATPAATPTPVTTPVPTAPPPVAAPAPVVPEPAAPPPPPAVTPPAAPIIAPVATPPPPAAPAVVATPVVVPAPAPTPVPPPTPAAPAPAAITTGVAGVSAATMAAIAALAEKAKVEAAALVAPQPAPVPSPAAPPPAAAPPVAAPPVAPPPAAAPPVAAPPVAPPPPVAAPTPPPVVAPPVVATPPPVVATPAPPPPAAPPVVATPPTPVAPTPPAQPPVAAPKPAPTGPKPAVLLTTQTLKAFAPRARDDYVKVLGDQGNDVLTGFGINRTSQRFCHFMAQVGHECGSFTIVEENLNYSAARMVQIFGPQIHSAGITSSEAQRLVGNKEAFAERVYGLGNPRKARDLGNTQPGDGYRYRGRGFLQITGRSAYREMGKRLGIDLEAKPDLAGEPLGALMTAAAFWDSRKLNTYADQDNIELITKRINGGHNGLADRKSKYAKAVEIWDEDGDARTRGATRSAQRGGRRTLEYGDIGPDVAEVKRVLAALGYGGFVMDEDFSKATHLAVASYQIDRGLAAHGMVDPDTWEQLDRDAKAIGTSTRSVNRGARVPEAGTEEVGTPAPAQRRGGGGIIAWGLLLLVAAIALGAFIAVLTPGIIRSQAPRDWFEMAFIGLVGLAGFSLTWIGARLGRGGGAAGSSTPSTRSRPISAGADEGLPRGTVDSGG